MRSPLVLRLERLERDRRRGVWVDRGLVVLLVLAAAALAGVVAVALTTC